VPLLINALQVADERARLQPAMIFAALALATLMRSSSIEYGASGSARALWLREAAGCHLELSLKAGGADAGLAQAALLLALFDASAHPQASVVREVAALHTLDHVIGLTGLLTLDIGEGTSTFMSRTASVVTKTPPCSEDSTFSDMSDISEAGAECSASASYHVGRTESNTSLNCTCGTRTANLGAFAWQGWELPSRWSHAQIWREEARRTVWAALGVAAAHVVRCVVFDREVHPLQIFNPENVCLIPYLLLWLAV
jgi:hypothetical protein